MPTHTAIQKGDRRIDYRGLREAALRLAVALRARGVQPGDRVALSLSNGIEAAIAWYGIWRAGAAVVPMNAQARERDFVPWLRHSGARLLRSEELTSELQSLMRIPYAVFCLKKKTEVTKISHILY